MNKIGGSAVRFPNYFLTCTANFGVVPLFFICFFLLLPLLDFLFALFVSVIFVFDTIKKLHTNYSLYALFIVFLTFNVKAFPRDIILSKGEQKEIPLPLKSSFSLGNSMVLSKKVLKNQILIKGKALGYTDLKIFGPKGAVETYKIYVLPRKQEMAFVNLAEYIKEAQLEFKIIGDRLKITGMIRDYRNYVLLEQIIKKSPEQFIIDLTFERKLKSKILGQIYEQLTDLNFSFHYCDLKGIEIYCFINQEKIKFLQEQPWFKDKMIQFIPRIKAAKNFKVRMKILQIENLKGKEINFGLNQLKGNFQSFFEQGTKSLIEENQILFSQKDLKVESVAEPEGIIILNEPLVFEIGSEIPFRADSQLGLNTQWKFAGLKIILKIEPEGDQYLLKYQTEFTMPHENTISGSKNKGKVEFHLRTPLDLFQIQYQTHTNLDSGIPLMKEVPLLGKLFSSTSKLKTYKKLVGVLTIEENGDL